MALIPADNLGAAYFPNTNTLILTADGFVGDACLGENFKRDILFVGGLKFFLEGYFGGLGPGKPEVKHFDKTQPFFIPNFRQVDPSGNVIIVTANHPDGVIVPVHWLGYGESEPKDSYASPVAKLSEAPPSSQSQISLSDAIVIDTVVGGKFHIKAALPPSPSGILDTDFNPYHLKLNSASAKEGNLIWDYSAVEEGSSQVIVDLIPSLPKPGESGLALVCTVYQINAHRPLSDLTIQRNPGTLEGSIHPYVTFLERVNEAVDIVRKDERGIGAELLQVYAYQLHNMSVSGGVASLHDLYCVFRTKDGQARIYSKGRTGWNAPTFLSGIPPPLGTKAFETAGLHGIVLAIVALREKGFLRRIKEARLQKELEPTSPLEEQPYYHFILIDDSTVKVGAISLDVRTSGFEAEKKANDA